MSRDVASLVYSRQVGSMARKAVLAYFAKRANDDGTGVWSGASDHRAGLTSPVASPALMHDNTGRSLVAAG